MACAHEYRLAFPSAAPAVHVNALSKAPRQSRLLYLHLCLNAACIRQRKKINQTFVFLQVLESIGCTCAGTGGDSTPLSYEPSSNGGSSLSVPSGGTSVPSSNDDYPTPSNNPAYAPQIEAAPTYNAPTQLQAAPSYQDPAYTTPDSQPDTAPASPPDVSGSNPAPVEPTPTTPTPLDPVPAPSNTLPTSTLTEPPVQSPSSNAQRLQLLKPSTSPTQVDPGKQVLCIELSTFMCC